MNLKILVQFLLVVLALLPLTSKSETLEINELSIFEINSAITPATFDYLQAGFKKIPTDSLIVIKLNTPGGLVTTTKEIISLFSKAPQPVAVWITPEGSSAASAGAIIASAAHFILMSPGTSLGAATPVGLGDDLKESDGRKKAMSDLKAIVRSLSLERQRPAKPFEQMIENADSFTAQEALDLKIADVLSESTPISKVLNGRTIKLHGRMQMIQFSPNHLAKTYEPSLGQKLLEVLSHPTTAYILFLVALALIYFEFQAPGGYIAGSIGICLLVIAGISFQVLPLSWGAFSLIVIGIGLLILELYVTSFGLLLLVGLAFFTIGSLFLFQDDDGLISVPHHAILSALLAFFGSGIGFTWFILNEKKKNPIKPNFFDPVGAQAKILSKNGLTYQVQVRGEIWNAFSQKNIAVDEQVIVTRVDKDKLIIEIESLHSPKEFSV